MSVRPTRNEGQEAERVGCIELVREGRRKGCIDLNWSPAWPLNPKSALLEINYISPVGQIEFGLWISEQEVRWGGRAIGQWGQCYPVHD